MAYEAPLSIKDVINSIQKGDYVLPSIQREFVWNTEQIETLFDSLMRNYPIGTFLFWQIDKTNNKNFQFYEFLKTYHAKDNRHNQKITPPDDQNVTAILDGQQRLTSIYIALTGTYANKKPHARNDNDTAYPPQRLYLNLLKRPDDLEKEYEFKFLTEDKVINDKFNHWFQCSKILDFEDMNAGYMFLMENKLMDTSLYSEEQSKFAFNALNSFFVIIRNTDTIHHYLEKGEELDKVLQIFVRINSGGTELNYSDLLLSMATAQWKNKNKDAREVIHEFVDNINQIGYDFKFNKDIVLKNCLVLADFPDTRFKVDNFNKKNMAIIERDWEKTSLSFRRAIELVALFGYNEKSLTAANAIIPISYFIYKNECADKILHHARHEDDRKAIREWLARVLLKGVFGSHTDSIFPSMQTLIKENIGHFPLIEIIAFYKARPKSISFNNDDIENLLDLQYNNSRTYCALSLIYPTMNPNFIYNKDHIHPKSKFTKKKMNDAGFSDEKITKFNAEMNGIANLQLLEITANTEKKDKPFKEWLETAHTQQAEKDTYLMTNHISLGQSLEFSDFLDFVANRKENIKIVLSNALGVI